MTRLELARQAVAEGITKHLQCLDEEMARLKKSIRDHIDNAPTLREKYRLLESVPGLGERTASTLLAFLAEPAHPSSPHTMAPGGNHRLCRGD
ncbi:hypothetical protein [Zoogloea dura]|uniref:IS110 family transposase n=1 Tax=Zoogloea dura TaxID=2728840 RepID=A0A848GHW1_9RHOO|nr:hypothetical protein [Zoogloea dura]NML29081.1 hypothetical protein [Zoogloea dura]